MESTTLKSTELMMALMLLSSGLSAQSAKTILGKWKGEEDAARQIEFFQEKDGSFSGRVINDHSKNAKNGTLIFKQLKYDEQSHTYKGQMTPPDAKLSINATLTFHENNRLEVVGKKFLLTKTFHFTRIQ
jgi:Uncharacterized protein conserved in bacteria (DUF2147)